MFPLGKFNIVVNLIHMIQDTAAVALLRKIVPTTATVTHRGDAANSIETSLTISFETSELAAIADSQQTFTVEAVQRSYQPIIVDRNPDPDPDCE